MNRVWFIEILSQTICYSIIMARLSWLILVLLRSISQACSIPRMWSPVAIELLNYSLAAAHMTLAWTFGRSAAPSVSYLNRKELSNKGLKSLLKTNTSRMYCSPVLLIWVNCRKSLISWVHLMKKSGLNYLLMIVISHSTRKNLLIWVNCSLRQLLRSMI